MRDPDLQIARQMVAASSRIVAFTGAGISAESGIPTYRDSESALWKKYDPMEVAEIESFLRDPREFWAFFKDARYHVMSRATPNPGHVALARMEAAGRLVCVITQNIDGLHQAAGSKKVIELHGNTRRIVCLDCGHVIGMEQAVGIIERQNPPPCPSCGGRLKPDVVFFGEPLPQAALQEAFEAAAACDLMLSVGSSLQVYPAASIPELAKRSGARLIIVNRTPTPFDGIADVVLRGPAGEVLPALAEVVA